MSNFGEEGINDFFVDDGDIPFEFFEFPRYGQYDDQSLPYRVEDSCDMDLFVMEKCQIDLPKYPEQEWALGMDFCYIDKEIETYSDDEIEEAERLI